MPEPRYEIIVPIVPSRFRFFVLKYSAALLTIATVNFDRLVEFYSNLLSQSPNPYRSGIYAGFRLPGLELGIFRPTEERAADFAPPSRSLGICLEVQNLDEIFVALSESEQETSELIAASHGREFYLTDPDGNRIILHQN
jgi:catechol 2,3-dioxygenase-like lactoylglutathione lyase family enzyme